MLSSGLLSKEITEILFTSAETVLKHVNYIYKKLYISIRIEAVTKFFRN